MRAVLLYGISGACIAGIPLALLLIYQSCRNVTLNKQISAYRLQEEQSVYLRVWTLRKDISAGERITGSDLEKKKIWVPETENMQIVTDIRKIMGKKAKTAIKKGTVLQKELIALKK